MKRGGGILVAILFSLLWSMCLLPQCARRVALSGGARDTVAPYIVRTIPPSGTTDFNGKRVRITFNEYVTLKDVQKEVYFSPPFRWPYATTLQGRTLVFEIADTLQPDVTYRLNLGNAVRDLTENNLFRDARYHFATGSHLDSAFFVGRVRDALLHTPVRGVKIMLYTEDADSVVAHKQPNYVSVSDSTGLFVFDNLPLRSFKLFALDDANSNYLYDQPKERVAFSDSLVHSYHLKPDAVSQALVLNLFSYSRKPLALLAATRLEPDQLRLIFSESPVDSLTLSNLEGEPLEAIRESSTGGDTILYWLKDARMVLQDTLVLRLRHKATVADSFAWRTDTLRLAYNFAAQGDREEQNIRRFLADSLLRITSVWAAAGIPFSDSLRIRVAAPVKDIDPARFLFLQDTVQLPITVLAVPNSMREFLLTASLRPRKRYTVRLLPGAVSDIWGRTNDTTNLEVTTLNPSQFSVLHLALKGLPAHALVQILTADGKSTVVRTVAVPVGATKLTIPYLPPNSYTLRIVDDRNANGQWDTGNYWERKQPEAVRYYKNNKLQAVLALRANWEYDIDIDYQNLEE